MYLFQYKSQLDLPGHSMKPVVMLRTREAVVGCMPQCTQQVPHYL